MSILCPKPDCAAWINEECHIVGKCYNPWLECHGYYYAPRLGKPCVRCGTRGAGKGITLASGLLDEGPYCDACARALQDEEDGAFGGEV